MKPPNTSKQKCIRIQYLIESCCFCLIILFLYTALEKILESDQFVKTLNESQQLSSYGELLAWLIPSMELIIVLLLSIPATRSIGFLSAAILLLVFTLYISYMLAFEIKLPCSCGGVLSNLSWKEHLTFNLFCIAVSIAGYIGIRRLQWMLSHNPP